MKGSFCETVSVGCKNYSKWVTSMRRYWMDQHLRYHKRSFTKVLIDIICVPFGVSWKEKIGGEKFLLNFSRICAEFIFTHLKRLPKLFSTSAKKGRKKKEEKRTYFVHLVQWTDQNLCKIPHTWWEFSSISYVEKTFSGKYVCTCIRGKRS